MDTADRPMLDYVVQTLQHSDSVSQILIATSDDASDDPIAAHCRQRGVACVRGDLHNVAGRFLMAMDSVQANAVFRVNGDSPLINRELFRLAADRFDRDDPDLVSNVFPRTYPPGMSVELLRVESFRKAYQAFDSPACFEHVTRFFYDHAERFHIENIDNDTDLSSLHAAVDTLEDWQRVDAVLKSMGRKHWVYSIDQVVSRLRDTA